MSMLRDPRQEYARTLESLMAEQEELFILDCGSGIFRECPMIRTSRYIVVDSPALMVSLAAGISLAGGKPLCHGRAEMLGGAVYEVFRGGSREVPSIRFIGVTGSGDFPSCDMAPMTALPDMTVLSPADGLQAAAALRAMTALDGPCYLRLPGQSLPDVTLSGEFPEIGALEPLRDGRDLCIFATGAMTAPALKAADRLLNRGVFAAVVHVPTVKPLDCDDVIRWARRSGRALVCEDHGSAGGLGDALCRILRRQPVDIGLLNDSVKGRSRPDASPYPAADAIYLRSLELLD